jgi:hypothetical protein
MCLLTILEIIMHYKKISLLLFLCLIGFFCNAYAMDKEVTEETPLFGGKKHQKTEITNIADLSQNEKDKAFALFRAVDNIDIEEIDLWIKADADLTCKVDGLTVSGFAKKGKYPELAKALKSKSAWQNTDLKKLARACQKRRTERVEAGLADAGM